MEPDTTPPPGHMRVPPTPWQGISWGILATHHPARGSKSSHLFFFGCTSRCLFPWSNHRLTTWRGGERPRFWPSSPRADHGDQAQQLAVLNSPCRSCPQNRGSSRLQGLHTLKVCRLQGRANRVEFSIYRIITFIPLRGPRSRGERSELCQQTCHASAGASRLTGSGIYFWWEKGRK